MPSGQPNRQNSLLGIAAPGEGQHPQETERGQPREPAASSHCSLPPRPPSGAPDGPPSGSSSRFRQTASTPITVWGETSRLRSAADHRRHRAGGSRRPVRRRRRRRRRAEPTGRRPAVRVGSVFSRLLTPKWVLLHLLVAALFVATFFLGYWQLSKAEAGGGAVNWSYALQWPLYGFMGLWFYLRMVRDRAAPRPGRGRAGQRRRPLPAAADRHDRRPRAGRLQRLPRRAQRAGPGPAEHGNGR